MTTTRTSHHSLASGLHSNKKTQVDVLDAARMYLSARDEGDTFRMEQAGRHLELIRYLFQDLNTWLRSRFNDTRARRE